MIVTAERMREIEGVLIAEGASAEDLMEEAGRGIAQAVAQFHARPGHCVVYAGKGNNAGDAFVAARELREAGWRIHVREGFTRGQCPALAVKKRLALGGGLTVLDAAPMQLRGPVIVLDGLLGIGATPPLREPVASLCREINALRLGTGASVIALDVPTGVDPTTGGVDACAVVADTTITLGLPKTGLFGDLAGGHVGRIAVVPLGGVAGVAARLGDETGGMFQMPTSLDLRGLLPPRHPASHKGDFGRLGIVAGSPGMTGAAVLASAAAVRAGAGLVTVFAMRDMYPVLAAAAPPEVMVTPVDSHASLPAGGLDALVIGPGLGRQHDSDILDVIEKFPAPCVVDADALNALSTRMSVLDTCRGPRLLTPHPGEMARLAETENKTRWEVAGAFADRHPGCTLLLKGAGSLVASHGLPTSTNQTGGPALASGGTGDCLAGICGALLAQGLSAHDAARLGAWLHGRAAEFAPAAGDTQPEAFAAGDIARHLGRALRGLREGDF